MKDDLLIWGLPDQLVLQQICGLSPKVLPRTGHCPISTDGPWTVAIYDGHRVRRS